MDTEKNPVYVIFGAAGGIGQALSRKLSGEGARLMLAGRSEDRLSTLARETGSEYFVLDATQIDAVEACLSRAAELYGKVDGVANCVGSLLLKPVHLTTEAEWGSTIATNLGSAFAVVRAASKAMMQTGGSIVLVSSAAARTGLANHEAIAAAKAGIIGLTLSSAATYGGRGIRVNCVAPGLIRTPLTERITGNETSLKGSVAMHAMGRIGEPEEVASAIGWLLDPGQSWVTGQVLGVDGGLGSVKSR